MKSHRAVISMLALLLLAWTTPAMAAEAVAVAGDPLQDLSELERVIFVMKGGEVVKAP